MEYFLPPPQEFTDEELDGFDQLSPREKKFAHFYLKTHKPAYSAVKAGYPTKTAKRQARRLLERPRVQRYMQYLEAQLRQMEEIDRGYIVIKLKEIVEKEESTDQVKVSALTTLAKMGGFLHETRPPQTFVFNVIGLENSPAPMSRFDKFDEEN